MKLKYKLKLKKLLSTSFPRLALYLLLCFTAIKTGAFLESVLSKTDINIIKNVDTNNFKSALNGSFPLINSVYNSGSTSMSLSSEFKNLVINIFGFDLGSPITIFSSQSPIFYYCREKTDNMKAENIRKDEHLESEDNRKSSLKEDSSSIFYEGGSDENNKDKSDSGSIEINNETKFSLNINELLKEPLKINFEKSGPKVLIYHTHTTESYLKSADEIGKSNIRNWSTNPTDSVVRVGEELAQRLRKDYGMEVIHNGTIHDYPDYNSSYANSLATAEKIIKSYPSIKLVFDIHRDGLGNDGDKLRSVTKINGKNAARVMFVVGTNQRLDHPRWKENLMYALKLQECLNRISPGLAKPIDLSGNRYNQHLSNTALIIEVGGDGNLIDESVESTKYLAQAIHEVVR